MNSKGDQQQRSQVTDQAEFDFEPKQTFHSCPYQDCQKDFLSRKYLKIHLQSHYENRPFQCLFTGCGKSFKSKKSLKTHSITHQSILPFTCDYPNCGKSFARQTRLKAHQHMHRGTQPHKCPLPFCGKAFAERPNLRIHMRSHQIVKPFKCSYCQKAFSTNSSRKFHESRHLNEKNNQNKNTDKKSINQSNPERSSLLPTDSNHPTAPNSLEVRFQLSKQLKIPEYDINTLKLELNEEDFENPPSLQSIEKLDFQVEKKRFTHTMKLKKQAQKLNNVQNEQNISDLNKDKKQAETMRQSEMVVDEQNSWDYEGSKINLWNILNPSMTQKDSQCYQYSNQELDNEMVNLVKNFFNFFRNQNLLTEHLS